MEINIHWGGGPDIRGPALLGLDVEGKQHSCRLIQIGYGEDAWLYDMSDPQHRDTISRLLSNPNYSFTTHSRYDQDAVMWSLGIDLTGRIRDTFLLACLVYPGTIHPHGLKPLSTKLIDGDLETGAKALMAHFKKTYGGAEENYKARGYNEMDVHDPLYAWYSGADAVYCLKLYHELKQAHLEDRHAMEVTAEVFFREQEISDIMGESSRRGLTVDRARAEELLKDNRAVLKEANDEMQALLKVPARSPKVGPWLEENGVEFLERTTAGAPKLDKGALKVLVPLYPDGKVGAVLKARQKASRTSNRVSNLQNFMIFSEGDGAVHPNVNTAVAATGRQSYTKPAMQTLKKGDGDTGLRSAFIARPGYVLIGADYDAQEMRVAAALSGDNRLAREILAGVDLHNVATESIFGPGSWKDPTKRAIGKVLNFAALFGAGPKAIRQQTGMSYDEAKRALKLWWDGWPALRDWNYGNMRQAETGPGYVVLDSGRRVPADPNKGYALTNYKVQGTARDITCQAILTYARLMPGTLALVVHDELLAEVPQERVEEGLAALNQAMNFEFLSTVEPTAIPMPITATAEVIGERWVKV